MEAAGVNQPQTDLAGRVIDLITKAAPNGEAEVFVDTTARALTRFANSMIHQNVADLTASVQVKLHADGRTVTLESTLTGADALSALVDRTVAAVRVAPRDPGWPGLAPAEALYGAGTVDGAIVHATADDRATRVRAFVDAAGGLTTAGYCQTRHVAAAFANSAGQTVAGESTEISMDGIARTPTSDGSAKLAGAYLSAVDGAALGARAAAKARAAADPVELAPGHYEVVLEPTAVGDVLQSLAVFGFNGKAVVEKQSFLEPGADQFDPAITLVDDAVSVGMVGLPFDLEGTPKRVVELVRAGKTITAVQSRRTAKQAGTTSTGHCIGGYGGVPLNLSLRPSAGTGASTEVDGPAADSSVAALIANVARGVLVTDHWYTRVLDPRTLVMTGLTRNGVWLIEDGAVTRPLRNFRFTQSYPQALAPGAVLGIGAHPVALPNTWIPTSFRAPALHLASWHFTGGASG
jgi:predicted Zn-dependent protease